MNTTHYTIKSVEDIKVGEIYNVNVKVIAKSENRFVCQPLLCGGNMSNFAPTFFNFAEVEVFNKPYPVPETAPKYDPCRKFRKGDIVEPSEINGRLPEELLGCYQYEVIVGEGEMTNPLYVSVKPLLGVNYKHLSEIHVNAAFLKLVIPVEEQERYVVIHNKNEKHFEVCWKDDDEPDGRTGRTRCRVTYWYHQPPMTYTEEEAKAAAEAECARLKVEYRKEMKK